MTPLAAAKQHGCPMMQCTTIRPKMAANSCNTVTRQSQQTWPTKKQQQNVHYRHMTEPCQDQHNQATPNNDYDTRHLLLSPMVKITHHYTKASENFDEFFGDISVLGDGDSNNEPRPPPTPIGYQSMLDRIGHTRKPTSTT